MRRFLPLLLLLLATSAFAQHPPYDVWCTNDGDFLFLKGNVAGYMQTYYELVEIAR